VKQKRRRGKGATEACLGGLGGVHERGFQVLLLTLGQGLGHWHLVLLAVVPELKEGGVLVKAIAAGLGDRDERPLDGRGGASVLVVLHNEALELVNLVLVQELGGRGARAELGLRSGARVHEDLADGRETVVDGDGLGHIEEEVGVGDQVDPEAEGEAVVLPDVDGLLVFDVQLLGGAVQEVKEDLDGEGWRLPDIEDGVKERIDLGMDNLLRSTRRQKNG